MTRRLARDVIADAASRLDDMGEATLADELRALKMPGRPSNPAHLQRLVAIHHTMQRRLAEGVGRNEVLAEAKAKHSGINVDWESILTLEGRPDLRAIRDVNS